MKRLNIILSFTIATALFLASLPPVTAAPLDFDVPYGHFFKQANGQGGAGDLGFAVVDDTAPFWSEFQRLGGVQVLGYPISRRFEWDGYLVQAFQKAIFQWRPEVGKVYFVNVFDRLSTAGKDDWLSAVRATPPSFDNAADTGLPWDDVVKRHYALLDQNPAIRARYFADSDPILHFGLPMSYKDYGNVFVVRTQRAVFQQWKVDVAWAKAGDRRTPALWTPARFAGSASTSLAKALMCVYSPSGGGPGGLALYATLNTQAWGRLLGSWWGDAGDDPVLTRSFNGGRTWEGLLTQ